MDNSTNKYYNLLKREMGVIYLSPTLVPTRKVTEQKQDCFETPKSAMEIRRKNGLKTSSGKRMVDLYREGK